MVHLLRCCALRLPTPPCARQAMEKRSVKDETKFLETLWQCDPRWSETTRPYSAKDVVSLRGSAQPSLSLSLVPTVALTLTPAAIPLAHEPSLAP